MLAVDSSAAMLDAVRSGAAPRGFDGRIGTRHVDVATASGLDTDPVDLVWSANALHEVADPARATGHRPATPRSRRMG